MHTASPASSSAENQSSVLRDVGADDAPIVDGEHFVDAARQPQTTRLEAAVVDRDQDRDRRAPRRDTRPCPDAD